MVFLNKVGSSTRRASSRRLLCAQPSIKAVLKYFKKKFSPLCNFLGALLRLMHENGLKPQTFNNNLKEIRQ
jgi:hypothetical protein